MKIHTGSEIICTECPNCNAIWTMEETEEQHCGACGYPSNMDDIDDDWDD